MALPKQVEQQMAEVAEMEKNLTELVVEQTGEPPVQLQAADAFVDAPETEVVAVQPEPEAKPVVPESTWEQKYLTLKGMFDSTVPPLHAKVKDLTQNFQLAMGELERLKAEKPAPVTETAQSITPEDEETFGKDLIELQRRIVSEAVVPLKSKLTLLETENATLKELMGRTGSEVATLTFEQRLLTVVPDFEQVNTSPQWIEWLSEIDPLSLEPRRAQAEAAYEAGNVAKVAHYVNLFKQGGVAAVPKVDNRAAELQSQVAPNRSQSAVPAPQQLKSYSEAEASRLYDRVAELNRAGKYEEAAKIDAELTSAYNSGRVR